jgi:hypothetical protein
MANNRVYTESVVTLNNQEATARLDELKKKALELRDAMAKIAQEKGINSKEFKAAQKELMATEKSINAVNADMQRFEKTLNNLNGSNLNELQAAARKLYNQMRKLKPGTDEFVAASKKLKEVRTRMKEIEGAAGQTQKMFGGFFKKIGWAGLLTGALATFKKFVSDMIAETQLIGDKWKIEVAGWKSAYGTFIADLSSGKGWNEMVQRMKDAYANGKKVAAMLDEIFERNNSAILQESELNLEAEKQKKIYMDATKSAKERIAAAEEYDRIQKQIAENRKVVAQEEMEAYKLQLQTRTELSDQELDLFIRDYNNNKDLIDQAKEYAAKVQEYETKIANTRKAQMYDRDSYSLQTHANIIQSYQDELDEFKRTADESVVYWSEIVAKYNLGNDEMVKNYVQARQKVVDADTNYERATQRSNRQAANIRKQLSQDTQKAVNDAYKKDIDASNARYQELQNQAKQAYLDGEISYEKYQQRLEDLNRKSLEERMAIAEKHKQSTLEFQTQIMDLAVKDKQKLEKLMDDLQKDAQKAMDDAMAELDKEVEAFMAELDKENEEQLQKWQELCERAEEIRRENSPIYAIKEEMAEELSALEELHKNQLLSEKDYQNARIKIIAKYASKAGDIYGEYLDKASDLANALQEADSARLDAQMQAELTAAGDNAEKRQQIEEEYEQKQLDLKKKYADVDMAINIAKTVANGAVAAVKAVADLGPIAGGIMAAIIAATTVAEVAAIVAQRNAIKNASVASSGSSTTKVGQRTVAEFSEGGYTERSANDYQEVGVVHANEWVAPAAMVRANPVMFASMEQMRQSGQYRSGVAGFADGGQAGGDTPASVGTVDNELLQRVYDIMAKLEASLPLKAYTVLSDLNAKQELDDTIKSVVGK